MAQTIDDFNRPGGVDSGPLIRTLRGKVAELDTHGDLLPEETKRRESRHAVYGAAVEFLADEGYLRYGSQAGGARYFAKVVLTSKGLAALQKTPEAMISPPSKTIGDALIDARAICSKTAPKSLIRQTIRNSFGVSSE